MALVAATSSLRPPLPRFRRSDASLLSLLTSRSLSGPKLATRWLPSTTTATRQRRQRQDSTGLCGVVRAHIPEDAPFAATIGATILFSLAFPVRNPPNDGAEDADSSGIDFTDTRYAVMAILTVIPYFNWMSWIFAWLDSGRQRYLVYAVVYLAPYIRTNFSISPDENWLPIASILACIFHVQLEESIRTGDIDAFKLLSKAVKFLSPFKEKDGNGPKRRCKSKFWIHAVRLIEFI